MGMMKEFLMQKVTEFADIHNMNEEEIYANEAWYELAVEYADNCLKGKPQVFRTDARLMAFGEQLTPEDLETIDVDAVALATEEEAA